MENSLKRRFVILVCAMLLALGVPRSGIGQVLIVQGSAMEVYRQAVSGFNQEFTPTTSLPGISSVQPTETMILEPDSLDNVNFVARKYQSLQPKIIVAVGSLALSSVASLPGPVIYLMVPDPDSIVRPRSGLAGVRMTVLPERQLSSVKEVFPDRTRIGLLHDPASSLGFLKQAQGAAESVKLTLVSIPASSDREAIQLLIKRENAMDALLLSPEPSLISPTLVDALAQFSLEENIPVIVFAPKYLEMGAAMAIFSSPQAMGRQAGRMVREYLLRPFPDSVSMEFSTEAAVQTNPRVIQKMGTPFISTTIKGGAFLP